MTREEIEQYRQIVKPFVAKILLETNYEGMGQLDELEFCKDFDEILDLAIQALKQEHCKFLPKMRDATKEELQSVKDYIDSISHDTGVMFYEKQEPVEDCISREAAKVLDLSILIATNSKIRLVRRLIFEHRGQLFS